MQATRGASLIGDQTSIGRHRKIWTVLAVAAIVVALDQGSKIAAVTQLSDGRVVEVFGDFLRLNLTRNPGAAFSTGANFTIVITVIAIAVIVFILRMSRRLTSTAWAIALGGFLGGALGNLVDRMFREPKPFYGHVVDFLELPNWPIFNLADSAIVGAAILVAWLSLRGVPLEAASHAESDTGTGTGSDTGDDGAGAAVDTDDTAQER
jgi:signal peptidase II